MKDKKSQIVWRTYSVFISSTFADMQGERDYLNLFVLPELNKELSRYGIILNFVDLRWGIDTRKADEDGVERKILRMCQEEIRRSRPFFLGLLGNRYGTVFEDVSLDFGACSITAMEIEYGFFRQNGCEHSLFLERDIESYLGVPEGKRSQYFDEEEKGHHLKSLKNRIKSTLAESGKGYCYQTYHVNWGNGRFCDFEEFGEKVKHAILHEILSDQDILSWEYDEVEAESVSQDGFLYANSNIVARHHVVDPIIEKLRCNSKILLHSESGYGKSCIYTNIVLRMLEDKECKVLYYSAAASSGSCSTFIMLKRWCYQLGASTHVPTNIDECIALFQNLLKVTCRQKKVIILIDALNLFKNDAVGQCLSFIPRNLDNCSFFCTSTTNDFEFPRRIHNTLEVFLLENLSDNEARDMVDMYAGSLHKDLYQSVRNSLLAKFSSTQATPLWLALSSNLITSLTSLDFENISEKGQYDDGIERYMLDTIEALPEKESSLVGFILQKMSAFYGDLPLHVYQLISVSYQGLTEQTIKSLTKSEWNGISFASAITYLKNLVSESVTEKKWYITNENAKLDLESYDKTPILRDIVEYYMRMLSEGKPVMDNILWYMNEIYKSNYSVFEIERSDIVNQLYNYVIDYRYRVYEEMLDMVKNTDVDSLISIIGFFDEALSRNPITGTNVYKIAFIHRLMLPSYRYLVHIGDNESIIKVSDVLYKYVENHPDPLHFISNYIYISTQSGRTEAFKASGKEKEKRADLMLASKRIKIRGPLSLFLVSCARKYYQYVLSNN